MIEKFIIDKGIYNNIDVIENTEESFNAAFNDGYAVKTKIQILSDNNFILFNDDAMIRLLNLKDSLKKISYDELEYISRYKILKLNELLKFIDDNQVLLEISNFSKKNCINLIKIIENYKNNFIFLSNNIKTLKILKKYGFIVSLKITRKNKYLLNSTFKPNFYTIDNGLLDRKRIKKLKEDFFVVGNLVSKDEIKYALEIYDNIIVCS